MKLTEFGTIFSRGQTRRSGDILAIFAQAIQSYPSATRFSIQAKLHGVYLGPIILSKISLGWKVVVSPWALAQATKLDLSLFLAAIPANLNPTPAGGLAGTLQL